MRVGLRELIFLGLLLAVPVAAWMMVFQPRHAQIERAREEIEVKQATLRQLAKVTNRIEDLRADIAAGQEALRKLDRKIPDRSGIDAILEQITQLAMKHQLEIRSVKGERPVAAPLYMELPLRMSIEGEFEGLYRFLAELERFERITRVHHLKATRVIEGKATETDKFAGLKVDLTMSIFFDPEPTSVALVP
ncbi:MAG: hypothetical protein FJ257_04800 [Phycisphaerae bacterium]|nr:hypothetical protein [Phycisphaerae bacterium]